MCKSVMGNEFEKVIRKREVFVSLFWKYLRKLEIEFWLGHCKWLSKKHIFVGNQISDVWLGATINGFLPKLTNTNSVVLL